MYGGCSAGGFRKRQDCEQQQFQSFRKKSETKIVTTCPRESTWKFCLTLAVIPLVDEWPIVRSCSCSRVWIVFRSPGEISRRCSEQGLRVSCLVTTVLRGNVIFTCFIKLLITPKPTTDVRGWLCLIWFPVEQYCINTPDYYFYLSQSECFQVEDPVAMMLNHWPGWWNRWWRGVQCNDGLSSSALGHWVSLGGFPNPGGDRRRALRHSQLRVSSTLAGNPLQKDSNTRCLGKHCLSREWPRAVGSLW